MKSKQHAGIPGTADCPRRPSHPVKTLAQFASIEAAVADALKDYEESHRLDPPGRQRAERDFRLFYAKAILEGARGIRWNWGGCILCPDNLEPGPRAMTRILL